MKKCKNIILMAILVLSVFAFTNRVNAARMTFSNQTIICAPDHLEKGETSKCYLVGKITSTGSDPLNGIVGVAYTSDDLILKNVETDVAGTATKMLLAGKSITTEEAPNNKYVTGEGNTNVYKCELSWYDLSSTRLTAEGADSTKQAITTAKSSYCTVLYSTSADSNPFTETALKSAASHTDALSDPVISTYAVLGIYTVQLDPNTDKKPNSRCGDICVKVWAVPAGMYYSKAKDCQSATPGDGSDCSATTTSVPQACTEIHLKGDGGSTETGAFASYAILAAGAFIAISAVAIAKKNNKLYKI